LKLKSNVTNTFYAGQKNLETSSAKKSEIDIENFFFFLKKSFGKKKEREKEEEDVSFIQIFCKRKCFSLGKVTQKRPKQNFQFT
jgi:hypothetical protein